MSATHPDGTLTIQSEYDRLTEVSLKAEIKQLKAQSTSLFQELKDLTLHYVQVWPSLRSLADEML